MYIVQSATTPAFISGCGTYLILKVSKTRLYERILTCGGSICNSGTIRGLYDRLDEKAVGISPE